MAEQVFVVGCGSRRRALHHARGCGTGEAHLERASDSAGDVVVHREQILQPTFVALGPELEAVGGVHQLSAHAYAVAHTLDSRCQKRAHVQAVSDRAEVRLAALEIE